MAQLSTANYPVARLKHVTGLDASGNVRHAFAPTINVKDFGAVGDGTTDDTAALKAAFDATMATGAVLTFDEGTYLVSGAITTIADTTVPGLHIHCKGLVTINVAGTATAFDYLIYMATTAANDASITGGLLRIDLNNKCSNGLWFRTSSASAGGVVNITAPVTILNAKQNGATSTTATYGIGVLGDYSLVYINQPRIVGVNRVNAGGGECKGIAISGFSGDVILQQPHIENVLLPSGGTDADGIACFAKNSALSETLSTVGKVTVNQPLFIDCQGRSFKARCSDVTVIRPRVYRKNYVSITQSVEFDFQLGGNHLLLEPDYEYRKNGVTSPLGASHTCVVFQNLLTDTAMTSRSAGGFIRTEVLIDKYSYVGRGTSAAFAETVVEGLRIVPLGSFATTAIGRAILETDGAGMVAATGKTVLRVNDVSGPIGAYGIGYTGYVSGSLAAKLDVEVTGLRNTLGPSASAYPFYALSGSFITQVDTFMFRANSGFRDYLAAGWTFNYNKLRPGCVFTVDLSASTGTNAPTVANAGAALGATGYATIECLSQFLSSTDATVRVTKGNASTANSVFMTQDGGTSWGIIK